MNVVYFAYGSNMDTERLRAHLPAALPIGTGRVDDKRMVCNKQSVDGSGKANLIESVGDVTWGVLYQLEEADLHRLDRIEGGYERTWMQVQQADGHVVTAVTYASSNLTDNPVAYDWYKQHIVDGARHHQLPADYLVYVQQLPSRPDSKRR